MFKLLTFRGLLVIGIVSSAFLTINADEQDCDHPETAEEVVKANFERIKEGDYYGAACLMHPAELAKFKSILVGYIKEADPENYENMFPRFYRVYGNDLSEFIALDSVSFMAKSMEIFMEDESYKAMFQNMTYEIMEIETIDDTLSGVKSKICVQIPDEKEKSTMELQTLKKYQGKWYMKLRDGMTRFLSSISMKTESQDN